MSVALQGAQTFTSIRLIFVGFQAFNCILSSGPPFAIHIRVLAGSFLTFFGFLACVGSSLPLVELGIFSQLVIYTSGLT